MNRRTLLKGITAVGVGLILPPTLAENVEAVTRRYWALDQTMLTPASMKWLAQPYDAAAKYHILSQEGWHMVNQEPYHLGKAAIRMTLYHKSRTPFEYAWAECDMYDARRRGVTEDQMRIETLVRVIDEAWSMR